MVCLSSMRIERHTAPVDEKVREDVLALVSQNVTALSLIHPPADHPKFGAYSAALRLEFQTYLEMEAPHRIELVTVSSDGVMAGFTLCGLPLSGSSSECGIYYTSVSKALRGNGLMSLMMNNITGRYPSVALSCDVALVPRYKRFGFRCESVRHGHIVMFIGDPVEDTPVLSTHDLMNHPSVMAQREKAEAEFSLYELDRADRAFAKKMKSAEDNAKRFFKTHK
ncbi:hypothetical protein GIW05_00750 [Pseudomonas syringae]|uniref:hypothetical protein n=1 Tax=Pseudomonas syringae TaxID=317 RepID=UPI001F269589|nr:hypothetical protein [Pseudomonas syringae]MCF5382050.1 hypothetical protein [Pseudomonas syringae]MCF5419416.1 hypothetical protein [Pseudomonas syringae]MCF5451963.1 hypothetical protein [Pseudomonas syringae]MCF5458747.1 hypothetical protein [Pseudomonas syringae]